MSVATTGKQSRRAAQKERTRTRLIEATIEIIAKDGLCGTTVGKVARKAGLSQGIVNFHFESKDLLFHETLIFLTEEYRTIWQAALDEAGEQPAVKLESFVRALFQPPWAEHDRLACWFAYWGDAYARGIYRRIGSRVDEELSEVLEALCVGLLEQVGSANKKDPREVVSNLVAMITGHWLMKLLRPQEVDLGLAMHSCLTYLRDVFPDAFPTDL